MPVDAASAQEGPKPGDVVAVGERRAVFLYGRGPTAVVRFQGQTGTRVVPFEKVRALARS